MITAWEYVTYCLRNSLRGPNYIMQTTAMILTIAFGVVEYFKPGWAGKFSVWLWLLPLILFVVCFVVSWGYAIVRLIEERIGNAKIIGESQDAMARVQSVRSVLLQHANEAPTEDTYTFEKGTAWIETAWTLANETTRPGARKNFILSPFGVSYSDFLKSVTSLKALASNLRAQDLRDGPP